MKSYWPDNPEEKSRKKLKYDNKIDLFDFVEASFWMLHNMINHLSIKLGYVTERGFDYNMSFHHDDERAIIVGYDTIAGALVSQELSKESSGEVNVVKINGHEYSFIKSNKFFDTKIHNVKYYDANLLTFR